MEIPTDAVLATKLILNVSLNLSGSSNPNTESFFDAMFLIMNLVLTQKIYFLEEEMEVIDCILCGQLKKIRNY